MRLFYLIVFFVATFIINPYAQVSFTAVTDVVEQEGNWPPEDCVVDMNGDYLDDIVQVRSNRMDIFYQLEDGNFEQFTFPWNFQNTPDWSMCAGDFDKNGYNDLVLGSWSAVSIVMANDNGTLYQEIAYPEYIFAQRSTAFDIDNDGFLDAFVCHDEAQNHPYRNDGTGKLALDFELLPTADMAGNYSSLWTDYDNDGLTDMFLTKCFVGTTSVDDPERINLLYKNNGDGTFTEVGEEANMNDNAQSWTTVFEDFNNDGWFDAFIVNHDFQNRMMLNTQDGKFIDIIDSTGIAPGDLGAWEASGADFDNDGYIDILSELSDELYLNNGDMTFTPQALPFDDGGIGDLNNDGFLDVMGGRQIYMNDGNDNNWIKFNTRGLNANINGIGSRVEIYGTFGMQVREVRSSQSFSPMSSLTVHFGLGQAEVVDSVIVRWPTGIISKVELPAINTTHNIVENPCQLPQAVLFVEGDLELCEGESVTLIAPPGGSVQWSNGETTQQVEITTPGSYHAIIRAAGCAGMSTIVKVKAVEEVPPVIAAPQTIEICSGDSYLLSVEGEYDEYLWSDGSTEATLDINTEGSYSVSVPGKCDGFTSSELIELVILNAMPPVVTDVIIGENESATLTAEGNELYWYDSPNGGAPIHIGAEFTTDVISSDTTFYVQNFVTGSEISCFSELVPVGITVSSIEQLEEELGLVIYPNPTSNELFVALDEFHSIQKITLSDVSGKAIAVIEKSDLSNLMQFDVSGLTTGFYLVQLSTLDKQYAKKIVVGK